MKSILAMGCLAYLLYRPVSNGQILYPVLAILVLVSATKLVEHRQQRLCGPFAACFFLLFFVAVIGTLLGSLHSTPGLGHQATVWIGGLVVWSIWAVSITKDSMRTTVLTITVITALLSALIILFVASERGWVPAVVPSSWLNAQGAGFGLTEQGSRIRLYGLSTLAAAGPLVAAAWFAGKDPYLPSRKVLAVASVLSFLASLMAGRRAIAVVMLLSPAITWLVLRALRPRTKTTITIDRRLAMAAPVLCLAMVWAGSTDLVKPAFASVSDAASVFVGIGRGSSNERGDERRRQVANDLLDAWGRRPLLGAGFGAALPSGYGRPTTRPWLFELQYHQLLYNTGLFGFTLVALALLCAWRGIKEAASADMEHLPVLVAVTVGGISLLATNASNPYLQAVGHGWGVALVAGVGNALLRPRPSSSRLKPRKWGGAPRKVMCRYGRVS